MKTIHFIIEVLFLIVAIFGLIYVILVTFGIFRWIFKKENYPDTSELSAMSRYKQTADFEQEILNNQNSIK